MYGYFLFKLYIEHTHSTLGMQINGENYEEVKSRELTKGKVFRNTDASKYLRVGVIKDIMKEALHVESLYNLGFPVPNVLEIGQIGDKGYYVEKSIGELTFGEKFHDEYLSLGEVGANTFKSFCDIICIYFHSQLNSPCYPPKRHDFKKTIMLSNILEENSDLDQKEVRYCIKKINKRLLTLPNVFSHGDLTPRNVFSEGIIDFEFQFITPVGFDVLTAPVIERFWNFRDKNGKSYEMFYLDKKLIDYYLERINMVATQHGLKDFLLFSDDFLLLKAFWMLAHEREFAKLSSDTSKWNFRKKILVYCMGCYLSNKRIDIEEFNKFDNSSSRHKNILHD